MGGPKIEFGRPRGVGRHRLEGRRGRGVSELEGVDKVEEQLAIAARKAGIAELRSASVERFRVDRFKERGA